MFKRELTEEFMTALLEPEGLLHPILEQLKKDQTLMLAIRNDYINIYYRGGNILKVTKHRKREGKGYRTYYRTQFDNNYNKLKKNIPDSPATIAKQHDAFKWVASFPIRKNIMDEHFSAHGNAEREFQQLVARENNYSSISGECEYFISDIEVAFPHVARFDMMAIYWPASKRKKGSDCKVALIEMKYGDGALEGDAGVLKHLSDMRKLVSDKKNRYRELLQTMEVQFNQLDKLGLLKFNKGKSGAKVTLNVDDTPEVIFILANHNPRKSKLFEILWNSDMQKVSDPEIFDLRFYVARFAGYGLHHDSMLNLGEFRKLCEVSK